ncbi:MAG: hypothetical protein WCV58_01495 [Patescibacteria group bacterium]|jgi:hypothetical protein
MAQKGVEAKIIEVVEDKAVLEIERQRLVVDSDCLPEKALAKGKLKLYFLNPEETVATEKKLAKNILEEILNGK